MTERRRAPGEAGISMLDATITVPFFIFIVFSVIDVARVGYSGITLQFALNRTSRWVQLGKPYVNDTDPAREEDCSVSRIEAALCTLEDEGAAYGIAIYRNRTYICPMHQLEKVEPDAAPCASPNLESTLGPDRLFAISSSRTTHVVLSFYRFDISRRVLGKTENYDDT